MPELKEYDGSTPLKRVKQEKFVSYVLAGLPQYKAYQKAYPNNKSNINTITVNASNLIRNSNVRARLDYRSKKIGEKTGISLAFCQSELMEMALECKEQGKHAVARACFADIIKTIGGFQTDSPNAKTLRLKELEAEKAKALKAALDTYHQRRYLANDEVTTVDIREEISTVEPNDVDFQPNNEGKEADFSQTDPLTPPGGGA